MSKRVVSVSVLKGEPTDGTGRVCIHLFVPDPSGPFVEPHALHPVIGPDGQIVKQRVEARPTRGRLACDPKRLVAPITRGNVIRVTHRTDSPDAVTCPDCMKSKEYLSVMERSTSHSDDSKEILQTDL